MVLERESMRFIQGGESAHGRSEGTRFFVQLTRPESSLCTIIMLQKTIIMLQKTTADILLIFKAGFLAWGRGSIVFSYETSSIMNTQFIYTIFKAI